MKYKGQKKLVDNIKKLMKEKHITQQELAFRVDKSYVSISCYLNFHRSPRLETIAAIAIALGVNVKELLKGIEMEEMIWLTQKNI